MSASVVAPSLSGVVREPIQARSKATFERILQAGIEVLMTDGLPGMNTNRVAEVAGVNIATVYAYFTNKESILAFLARRFEDERATWLEQYAAELGISDGPTWEQWYSRSIDAMVRFRVANPGSLAVRQALIAMPELRDLDRWSTQRATEANIAGLRRIAPKLTQAKARAISHTYSVTVTAVLDEAFSQSPYDRAAIRELKQMIIAYLGSYLPPSRPRQ